MTTRTRLAAVTMAVLMLASAAVTILPAAEAQEVVPSRPGVTLEPLPSLVQRFYATFGNQADDVQADCTTPRLDLQPAIESGSLQDQRADCIFTTGTLVSGGNQVAFEAFDNRPIRRIGFSGNQTAFVYHHEGEIPEDVTLNVIVESGGTTLAETNIVGDGSRSYTKGLDLRGNGITTGRVFAEANQPFTLTLTATSTGTTPVTPPVGGSVTPPAQWRLDDTNSYLELRSDDAIRAALWVTDEKDELKTIFAPIANESQLQTDRDRRFVGHFALQSAFGASDARGSAPRFSVLFDGKPVEVAAGGQSVLTGVENASASSVERDGLVVWSFPSGTVNYRGFKAGAYTLHVEKTHHQGAPINRAVDKTFNITAQSVALRVFSDARYPLLTETQAHPVQPGGSTTYVLAVDNTGSVNDTFTISISTANAPAGWGATIGGPDVLARRIVVPAGNTSVFTVTVNAPLGATGEVIHLVNVTSTLDPGARSRDLTLVTSVRTDPARDVGVIFLPRDLALEPGVETQFPVYVWNRGARAANVSLEITGSSTGGWVTDLAFGNSNVDRIVLSSIQPGDIAEATLKVTGPIAGTIPTQPVTLNATLQDAAGISFERTQTFTLRVVSGVTLTVLNTIGARTHVAEVTGGGGGGGAPGAPGGLPVGGGGGGGGGPNDGLDGLWFRVWVANTGRVQDTFDLTLDTIRSNCNGNAAVAFAAATNNDPNDRFGFYTRGASGEMNPTVRVIDLTPGKTAEVYVFLPVVRTATPCNGVETLTMVAQAKGNQTLVVGRGALEASARNSGANEARVNGLHLEGVSRESGYDNTKPYVNTANANRRTIVASVDPGKNVTYYVRMTNAASWGAFTTGDVTTVSDLHVTLSGVDYEGGWNVSIRPVLTGQENEERFNPYGAEANLSNTNTKNVVNGVAQREGWFDRELEVRVTAPSIENGTAVAGLRHEFQLIAETNTSADKSTLEIATVIGNLADIKVKADKTRIFAHPGEPSAFLLLVSNNGSSQADVTLRASMTTDTPNGGSWQVSPNAQRFPLPAFKNRTIAVLVTPPAGAVGGNVNLSVEFAPDPLRPNDTRIDLYPLNVDVTPEGTLQLTTNASDAIVGPGGTVNFAMTLRNSGGVETPFRMAATGIPNWSVDVSPRDGRLTPGQSIPVVLTMRAPADVTNDTRFASVVSVEENAPGGSSNFDSLAFTANILGGKAIPRLSVPNLVKRVDRAGVQTFEVQVQNVGSAAGRLDLENRSADPGWLVGILDQRGNSISSLTLTPNELATINVTVRAPFSVPERTVVPVEITAFSPDRTQAAKATLSAEVHDYGVQLSLVPGAKDALPGLPTEFTVRLKNTGNDNDTLNLSANLHDLPEWSVQLSSEEVRLEPNQEIEVRATIRSPTGPLPSARAYTFPFWVGTRGGQEVNLSKNMTQSAVVTIPNYRSYDVDRDGQLEIAVDLDKRQANGFEEFRDVFTEGLVTQVVARGNLDGRATFFLDVPRDRPYDGVADVWFNPETVYSYEILHAPDANNDGTPDYFLDVDRDGKIDRMFDTATERFLDVEEVKVFGDERIQYLIDLTGDGKPDRFFDPENGLVTRTQSADDVGEDYVGIDVDDDDRVDYYYNTRTQETSQAEVTNVGSFAKTYWYFFVAFAALVVLSIVLISRRRKAP